MRIWKRKNEKDKERETLGAVTHTHTHTHKHNIIDITKTGGTAMNTSIKKEKEYSKKKYSKKYVKKVKKKLQISMFSIAMVLLLIVGCKLAGLPVPLNNIKDIEKEKLTADESKTLEGETIENRENAETNKVSKVTIAEDGAIECESIVQGVRDSELENGTYTFRVTGNINGTSETKDYKI